jgi:hypothetical protein
MSEIIEAMNVIVEYAAGGDHNTVTVNLNTVDPDKDQNNHVYMIGIVSLVKGMASDLGISADEMWDRLDDFRTMCEPEWEDVANNYRC